MLTGEFQVICSWLLKEIVDFGLWDDRIRNMIIANNGEHLNLSVSMDLSVFQNPRKAFQVSLTTSKLSQDGPGDPGEEGFGARLVLHLLESELE